MSRDLTAGMLAEVIAGTLKPVLFFEGEFASDTIYLWTGQGSIVWDAKTWVGAGQVVSFSAVQETTKTEAVGFQISILGESTSNASRALQSCRQNKPGKIWLGALDAASAVIADPYELRAGKLSYPELQDDAQAAMITIVYEDELTDLLRPRERRYTSEDQKLTYPSDRGFDFVETLQDAVKLWGGAI